MLRAKRKNLLVAITLSFAGLAAAPFHPPAEKEIPQGAAGDEIREGLALVTNTSALLKNNARARLNCTSCHLNGGRTPFASPFVGLWGVFPEYRARSGRKISLAERVNDCFERSLNGKALPQDSREMRAILAYIKWLSRGVPAGVSVEGRGFKRLPAALRPNRARGGALYFQKCALCHGPDGAGKVINGGEVVTPALWGKTSFNIGAGMARLGNAAAFVKWNMPLWQGGSLTDQDALDIADDFIHRPRPDFAKKKFDWPKGGKPNDARY